MKNCGEDLHAEVFSKSFMEAMKTVVKVNDKLIQHDSFALLHVQEVFYSN